MPDQIILKKYADVLVKFALGGGKGIKPGEVVVLQVPECAKEMLLPLESAVLEAGGHTIVMYQPEIPGLSKNFFEKASEEQLIYFPEKYMLARVEVADHFLSLISTTNLKELEGVDPKKIMLCSKHAKFYWDARRQKEAEGKQTWTLGLFGTEVMAKEAGLTLEEYWEEIINACFLYEEDPIKKWKEVFGQIEATKKKLDALEIEWVEVKGEDVDLKIKLGEGRKWLGGGGANIPSFELFISPDWRGTDGWIKLNQPLYRYGNIIKDIELQFENGKVVEYKASQNLEILKEMIATENADKIGEFSLTDKRFSKISKFMAQTLFDENFGGEFGNTHIALGNAYKDSYPGDASKLSKEDWDTLGYNDSVVHTDVVSTTDRVVTAILKDGTKKIIYKGGEFVI